MKNEMRRIDRRKDVFAQGVNTVIERLRKTRALSCNPSDVGMDSYLDWLTRYGNAYFFASRIH